MKVTYHFPAHPSYFTGDYTQKEVDQAISAFKSLTKPGQLGEIPEEFVFLTQPGKTVAPVFCSAGMSAPDEATGVRWTRNTLDLARAELDKHVEEIRGFLQAVRNLE